MKESEAYSLPDNVSDIALTLEHGLPANIEAEKTILGAILLNNEVFFDEIADLNVGDFSLESHRMIFSCMNDIFFGQVEDVNHVDIVTLSNELQRRKKISSCGGVAYLAGLTEGLPRRISCEEYVKIVRDKAKLRGIMNICSTALARAADQSESASIIAADIQEQLIEESADVDTGAVRLGDAVPEVRKGIEAARKISSERTALDLTFGLSGLDEFTKGASGGEFSIIAGETNSGKTPFAVQMTLANAREGIPCAWFSLEMTKGKLIRRFYPAMGDIIFADHMKDPRLINGHTHIPEMDRLEQEMHRLPIWIDDTSPLSINKLVARIRMMRRKLGIRFFIIDYLQLIQPNKARTDTEEARSTIFAIRDLVKAEPTIHLLLVSQYSRSDGFVKKKKRTKENLYGGSALEHSVQNIFLLSIESDEEKHPKGLLDVEIVIAKQREGRKGRITCSFDRDHLRFTYPQPVLNT